MYNLAQVNLSCLYNLFSSFAVIEVPGSLAAPMANIMMILCFASVAFAMPGSQKRRLERAGAEADGTDPGAGASSSSAPRGSLRRRLDRASQGASSAAERPSPLAGTLMKQWASGQLSSAKVQEIAEAATASNAEGVGGLSSAGPSGRHPQNLQRSLLRMFGRPSGAPDFTWVRVPTSTGHALHPVFLPHQFFGELFHHAASQWMQAVRGPEGMAGEFWKAIRDSSIVAHHRHLNNNFLHKTIPIGLHGDGGSFSHQDQVLVMSWNSICGSLGGSGFGKRFIYTIVRKQGTTPATLEVLWKVLSWSMNVLLTGITPAEDWEQRAMQGGGEWIAAGWRASLIQIRGDWEFYANTLGFPHWGRDDNMCWMCAATGVGKLAWRNFAGSAPWRATRRSHRSWLAGLRNEGKSTPVLFALILGLSLGCLMVDVLHAVDLGVTAHIVGNVFAFCIRQNVWGAGTIEKNTACLHAEIDSWSKAQKVSAKLQGELKWNRIKTESGFPKIESESSSYQNISRFRFQPRQAPLPVGSAHRCGCPAPCRILLPDCF